MPMQGSPMPGPAHTVTRRRHTLAALLSAVTLLVGYTVTVVTPASAGSSAALAACGTSNVALNKPATASSSENSGLLPAKAVDGTTTTRWSSAFSDPQWLQVDLGAST